MKKLSLLLIVLFLGFKSVAQKDSSELAEFAVGHFEVGDSWFGYETHDSLQKKHTIWISNTTKNIKIEGDTMVVIRNLLEQLRKGNELLPRPRF